MICNFNTTCYNLFKYSPTVMRRFEFKPVARDTGHKKAFRPIAEGFGACMSG